MPNHYPWAVRHFWDHLRWYTDIPSGKRLHSYGKSPFLMGKSTINCHFQIFNSYVKLPGVNPNPLLCPRTAWGAPMTASKIWFCLKKVFRKNCYVWAAGMDHGVTDLYTLIPFHSYKISMVLPFTHTFLKPKKWISTGSGSLRRPRHLHLWHLWHLWPLQSRYLGSGDRPKHFQWSVQDGAPSR